MVLIVDYDKTMDAGLANGIKDGIETIVNRTGVYAGEVLDMLLAPGVADCNPEYLTSGRFCRASPTLRLSSSYAPPLRIVITSTASKTLTTTPIKISLLHRQRQVRKFATITINNRHTRDALVHKLLYDV